MGLGNRNARKHDTGASRKHAVAYDYDFSEGDRVLADGLPGVVGAIYDGPVPGMESYHVTLDGGLGGGEYRGGDLSALKQTKTSGVHTADQDYPELAEIYQHTDPSKIETFASVMDARPMGDFVQYHDYPKPKEGECEWCGSKKHDSDNCNMQTDDLDTYPKHPLDKHAEIIDPTEIVHPKDLRNRSGLGTCETCGATSHGFQGKWCERCMDAKESGPDINGGWDGGKPEHTRDFLPNDVAGGYGAKHYLMTHLNSTTAGRYCDHCGDSQHHTSEHFDHAIDHYDEQLSSHAPPVGMDGHPYEEHDMHYKVHHPNFATDQEVRGGADWMTDADKLSRTLKNEVVPNPGMFSLNSLGGKMYEEPDLSRPSVPGSSGGDRDELLLNHLMGPNAGPNGGHDFTGYHENMADDQLDIRDRGIAQYKQMFRDRSASEPGWLDRQHDQYHEEENKPDSPWSRFRHVHGSKTASDECNCRGSKKIEPHSSAEHQDWAERNHAAGKTDAWGHPIMQPYDGHGAFSCNNHECSEHPKEMYDYQPGQGAPSWFTHDTDPDRDIKREVNKAFHETGQHDDARYLMDQQHQGPSKLSAAGWEPGHSDEHGPFNSHGQCSRCGHIPPTEGDEPCDHEWCVHNEPEHTKAEHIDPPHLDPGHPDYQSAEHQVNDAFGDEDHGWLLDSNHQGPSHLSSLDPHEAASCIMCLPHLAGIMPDYLCSAHALQRSHGTLDHYFPDTNPVGWEAHSRGGKLPDSWLSLNPHALIVNAAQNPDLRFSVTASWADVRNKAKALREESRVKIAVVSEGYIQGEVEGDHGTYAVELQRMPGRQAIAAWTCGCAWMKWAWGRFAGRLCSHAYALQLEAQSRGMFGNPVTVDEHHDFSTLERPPLKYKSTLNTEMSPLIEVVAAALAQGDDYEELQLLLRIAGFNPGGGNGEDEDAELGAGNADGSTSESEGHIALLELLPELAEAAEGAGGAAGGAEGAAAEGEGAGGGNPLGDHNKQQQGPSQPQDSGFNWDTQNYRAKFSTMNESPSPALPMTDGLDEEQGSDTGNQDLTPNLENTASLQTGMSWLMEGSQSSGNSEIARMAMQTLAADFSAMEQSDILNEGIESRANNLDRLELGGTHYAELMEDDDSWLT